MPRFIQVNDHDHEAYSSPSDVVNLVKYVMNPQKARYKAFSIGNGEILTGCSRLIPEPYCHDPVSVASFMLGNNQLYRKTKGHLMKHRIITFNNDEFVTPFALSSFGLDLMDLYFSEGFISCYGIHMDTGNLHLHYAVDCISMKDGSRFYIREKETVLPMLLRWYGEYWKDNACYWTDEDKALFFQGNFSELEVPD